MQEAIIDGVHVFVNPETGEIREPRFEMEDVQAFQNEHLRLVMRVGKLQAMLELYDLSEQRKFTSIRFDLRRIPNREMLNNIVEQTRVQMGLDITDLLPAGFEEYKANFRTGRWLKPKSKKAESFLAFAVRPTDILLCK